jgi:hypothetical protein
MDSPYEMQEREERRDIWPIFDDESDHVRAGFDPLIEKAINRLLPSGSGVVLHDPEGNLDWMVVEVSRKSLVQEVVKKAFDRLHDSSHKYGLTHHHVNPRPTVNWDVIRLLGSDWCSSGTVVATPEISFTLGREFHEHATKWTQETAHLSSATQMILHPSYQRIIGMGPQVLPLIFQDLEKENRDWFWALTSITGTDPVPPSDAGNVPQMKMAWLQWGKARGYV